MKKRSKREIQYWGKVIQKMFSEFEDSYKVENRFKAIRYLLSDRYDFKVGFSKESSVEMLKDAIYLDRTLRRATEGKEQEIKDDLEEEWLEENYGGH